MNVSRKISRPSLTIDTRMHFYRSRISVRTIRRVSQFRVVIDRTLATNRLKTQIELRVESELNKTAEAIIRHVHARAYIIVRNRALRNDNVDNECRPCASRRPTTVTEEVTTPLITRNRRNNCRI